MPPPRPRALLFDATIRFVPIPPAEHSPGKNVVEDLELRLAPLVARDCSQNPAVSQATEHGSELVFLCTHILS
jgi:hypothetical protein